MGKIFRPDQAEYRRLYEDEMIFMQSVVDRAGADGLNMTDAQKLYASWVRLRDDDAARRLVLISAGEFGRQFGSCVRIAESWIARMVKDHLDRLHFSLEPIDEVASSGIDDLPTWARNEAEATLSPDTPPLTLNEFCGIADGWGQDEELIQKEALRKITIASKIMALEAVDSWNNLSRDMVFLNRLCAQRLWAGPKVLVTVNYAVHRDPANLGRLHVDVPITFGGDKPQETLDVVVYSRQMKCRVAQDGSRTYLVHTSSRPKDLFPTLLKEEQPELDENQQSTGRCRPALDRRGLSHVIVARGEGGRWQPGTREDVTEYASYVKRELWRNELTLDPTPRPRLNPYRHPDFVNEKFFGRLLRASYTAANSTEALSVEHQVLDLRVFLNVRHATDKLNHDIYRRSQEREVLVKKWWPQLQPQPG